MESLTDTELSKSPIPPCSKENIYAGFKIVGGGAFAKKVFGDYTQAVKARIHIVGKGEYAVSQRDVVLLVSSLTGQQLNENDLKRLEMYHQRKIREPISYSGFELIDNDMAATKSFNTTSQASSAAAHIRKKGEYYVMKKGTKVEVESLPRGYKLAELDIHKLAGYGFPAKATPEEELGLKRLVEMVEQYDFSIDDEIFPEAFQKKRRVEENDTFIGSLLPDDEFCWAQDVSTGEVNLGR